MKDYKKYKKHLSAYIKENMRNGYSIQAIEKALLIYGYEKDLVSELIRNYKLKNIIAKSAPLALLLLLMPFFFYIKPDLAGYVVKEASFNFTDGIGLAVNESYEYSWDLENKGQLKSVRLNGKVAENGFAKVYLEHENYTYLIFDNIELKSSLEEITSFAVKEDGKEEKDRDKKEKNESGEMPISETALLNETDEKESDKGEKEKEEDKGKEPNRPPVWNSSIESFIVNETLILDLNNYFEDKDNDILIYSYTDIADLEITLENSILTANNKNNLEENKTLEIFASDNETSKKKNIALILIKTIPINETINITPVNETINITQPLNKSIAVELQYNKNTPYDANDDGIESSNGAIDFTVENTKFNWDYNENSLCTRWEIYSIEDDKSTVVCYGSSKCCNFIDLKPARKQWNEILYLTYGQYGASFDNIISAQVLYADYKLGLDEPFAGVYYSEWQNLSAKFLQGYISFENACIETCVLPNLNATSYKLKFEMDNSSLVLDSISYEIFGYEKTNNAPVLLKNFSNISIFSGQSYALNLSEYFYDEDNDTLTYSSYNNSAIGAAIANETAVLIPIGNFTGKEYMFFTANDSVNTATSNIFEIEVKQRGRFLKSLRRLIGA